MGKNMKNYILKAISTNAHLGAHYQNNTDSVTPSQWWRTNPEQTSSQFIKSVL